MVYECKKTKFTSSDYEKEFICDSEEDIAVLPECSPGSMAIVAKEGMPIYMKNASGEWVKV